MKKFRLLATILLMGSMTAAFTSCSDDCDDPDPLKETIKFVSATGVVAGENGTTANYIIELRNTDISPRSSAAAVGETVSLELSATAGKALKTLPSGTYTFGASGGNAIVEGPESYMTSVYSGTTETFRNITGGSITVSENNGTFSVTGTLSSDSYRFTVDYSGEIAIAYPRTITFEDAAMMYNTGNTIKYNGILWGMDLAEEDDYGMMKFDGILYEEKGVSFGSFWNDFGYNMDTWGGLAVSANNDKVTNTGYKNQFSVYASNAGKFAVAYDLGGMGGSTYERPAILFKEPSQPLSAMIAHTTQTYLYCVNKIEGGLLPDFYFTLQINGFLEENKTSTVNVELVKNGKVIGDWTKVDLSPLGKVTKIEFRFDGNDANSYGLLTPTYFCIDDIVVE